MSNFDMDGYLQRKFGNAGNDKILSLQEASQQKLQKLAEYRATTEANQAANADSWVSKLGLDPEGITGTAVNLAASLASGTTRLAGQVASLPTNVASMQADWGVPDEAVAAYNRTWKGEATPEDTALLKQRGYAGLGGDGATLFDQLEQGSKLRQTSRNAVNALDTSSIVDQTKRQHLTQELESNFEQPWQQVQQGWEAAKKGDLAKGASDLLPGVAKLLFNVGEAAIHNPAAAGEYIAENLPQLAVGALGKVGSVAMTASNVGYGADLYQQGIEEYQKQHGGGLPPVDVRQNIAMHAAGAVLAEDIGDRVSLGFMKPAKALEKAAEKEIRTGFKQALLNTGKAAGEGLMSEGSTEGYQTYAEGEATLKPASAKDIYVGGAIGGISGAGLSGGGRALGEMTGATPEHVEQKQQEIKKVVDLQHAIDTKDTSAYLDPESKTYDPAKGIQVLYGHSQKETTTPEQQQQNAKEADKILADMEEKKATLEDALMFSDATKLKAHIQEKEAEVIADPIKSDTAMEEYLKGARSMLDALIAKPNPADAKAIQKQLDKVTQQLDQARTVKTQLDTLVQTKDLDTKLSIADTAPDVEDTTAVATHKAAVEHVINLSMVSPHLVSAETANQLASNKANGLTDAQRTHLRVFSEARIAENKLKDMDTVSRDIFFGSSKKGQTKYMGIDQYNTQMATAVATDNKEAAKRSLAGLMAFAVDHQAKLATAKKALATVQGRPAQILRNKEKGSWMIAAKKLPYSEVNKNGGLTLKSSDLVTNMETEVATLAKSVAAMKSTYATKFGKGTVAPKSTKSTQKTIVEEAAPAAKVTTVEANSVEGQTQSKTESTVDTVVPSTKVAEAPAEQTPTEPSKDHAAGLTALQEKPQEGKLGAIYRTMNKAAAFLKQKKVDVQKDSQIRTVRPLVAIQNLLQRWKDGEIGPQDFFPEEELSEAQTDTLLAFKAFAESTLPIIKKGFIKGTRMLKVKSGEDPVAKAKEWQEKYSHNDPIQDFLGKDKDGNTTVDENILTAVAVAAYTVFTDTLMAPPLLEQEQILKMHGISMDDGAVLSKEAEHFFRTYTSTEDTMINSLGAHIVDVLGIQVQPNAPIDYLPRVTAAFGIHALQLLEKHGVIERLHHSPEEVSRLIPEVDAANARKMFSYVKVIREKGSIQPTAKARDMRDSVVGSQDILGKFFGPERVPAVASWKPMTFRQEHAKRTLQNISKKQLRILEKAQKQPNRIIPAMWDALNVLGDEVFLKAAGWREVSDTTIHINNKDSVETQNRNLENQLEGMKSLVQGAINTSPKGIAQPFYANFEVWRNFRVGITTHNMNLQSSKIHRYSFFRPEWESTIKLSDDKVMEDFMVAVAAAFGIKTDQQRNEKTLEMFKAKLADPESKIESLARALNQSIENQATPILTPGQKDDIAALAAKAEGMQTIQALVAYGKYLAAKDTGKAEFKAHLLVGVDGKTNGPILTHLALGAMNTVNGLFGRLNRGGMYQKKDGAKNYAHWYERSDSLDLYEDLAQVILSKLDMKSPAMMALQRITKPLLTDKGKVTSAGRGIVKTPMTSFAFGSSPDVSLRNMRNTFIQSIYDQIERTATGSDVQRNDLINSINTLTQLTGSNPKLLIPANLPSISLMQFEFKKPHIEALGKAFEALMGDAVRDTLDKHFATFIQRRRAINKTIGTAFGAYQAIYDDLYRQETERLLDSGDIAYTTGKDGRRIPLHGMSLEQEKALRDRVKDILPRTNTTYTLDTQDLDAGLFMGKRESGTTANPLYKVQAQLGYPMANSLGNAPFQAFSQGKETYEVSPGVAGLPYLMHSFDSGVMHESIEDTDTLNVHDDAANGVHNTRRTAVAINKALWSNMLAFSPAKEAYELLHRSIVNSTAIVQTSNVSTEAMKQFIVGFSTMIPKKLLEELRYEDYIRTALGIAKAQYHQADKIRLGALAQMESIDQYTWEHGEYTVTNEDRDAAQAQLDALEAEGVALTDKEKEEADALSLWFKQVVKARREQEEKDGPRTTPKSLGISPVLAPVVMVKVADELGNTPEVQQVTAAIKQGETLSSAINALDESVQDAIIETSVEANRQLSKVLFSPFGELGKPLVTPEGKLVRFFAANPQTTAKEAIDFLAKQGGLNEFNLRMLRAISKVVDPTLPIRYVTQDTSIDSVLDKGADGSRGWYVSKGDKHEICLLSPDFKHSALQSEVVLHELIHGALARTIETELAAKKANPKYNSPALRLINDLETLRIRAKEVVDASPEYKDTFAPALTNVHELVSWGMSNQAFQENILKTLAYPSQIKSSVLVSGMKKFIQTLSKLIFGADPYAETALGVLISDVSGLFLHASKTKPVKASVNLAQMARVLEYTTETLYDSLQDSTVTHSFDLHLRDLLSGIVDKLHGPFGTLMADRMRDQTLAPKDVWQKALDEGVLPFAGSALKGGFPCSEKVAFAMDQVEATVRAALDNNEGHTTVAYRELTKLYNEVSKAFKVQDFHEGDWSQASAAEREEAQALYDFMFKMEKSEGDRSDYLARFAALGLAHPKVNALLKQATDHVAKPEEKSFIKRLENLFEQILEWFAGKLTNTYAGQMGDAKLHALIDQLVGIEAKQRAKLLVKEDSRLSLIEDSLKNATDKVRDKVEVFGRSTFFKNSTSAFVKAGGAIASTIAGKRVDMLLDGVNQLRDSQFKERQGVLAGLVNEIRGANDSNRTFHEMLREGKRREGIRQDTATYTANAALESFANKGEDLTQEAKDSITAVFLRTGMHVLLDHFSMQEIQQLLNTPATLQRAIKTLEKQLATVPFAQHFYAKEAHLLGFYKATGKVKGAHVLMNAHAIARLMGTAYQSKVSESQATAIEGTIDQLITLRALQHSKQGHLNEARQVIATEVTRGKESGIEMILKLHKALESQSKERLFNDSPALMVKGYTPELYNPQREVLIADAKEGAQLRKMGYSMGARVANDPRDPDKTERRVYTRDGGGLRAHITGIVSFTGKRAKGSRAASEAQSLDAWKANRKDLEDMHKAKQADIKSLFAPDISFDPNAEAHTYAAPVLDAKGGITDYRYLMQERRKDVLLDRDNRFEKVLGALAGNIYDKESTKVRNHKVVQALYDYHTAEYALRAENYLEVSPNSKDPELREIYYLLPEDTKQSIKEIWGKKPLMIRADLLDITFGYRKLSLSDAFDKQEVERSTAENIFVDTLSLVLGDKAALRLRRAEDIWQEFVHETKDILVIKNVSTLIGNVLSNTSALLWAGVSPLDMIKYHRIALKGAMTYRKDSVELAALKLQLNAEYVPGDRKAIERRVIQLEDALTRNPIKELVDAGLMPTIVEDVTPEDDLYSYKSRLVSKVNEHTKGINKTVLGAVRTVYMAHDTKMYQTLNHATQLSDFLSRYVLYQHVTLRKRQPLSKKDAIQLASDMFVNYDVPSHRTVQYLNDMGFVWFTKYYLRIQKVIAQLYQGNPGRALGMLTLEHYFSSVSTLMDSEALNHVNSPFSVGAFKYPGSLDELATVKLGMGFFK